MKAIIEGADGKVEVEAVATETPGLIITDVLLWDSTVEYGITHEASGLAIGPALNTKKEARRMVRALGKVADWTLSTEELRAIPGLSDRVAEALGW